MTGLLEIAEIEFVEFADLFLFCLREWLLQQFTRAVGVEIPDVAKVFGNMAFFLRAEAAKGAAEKNQRAAELFLVKRANEAFELLPQFLSREQSVSIALGETLEPSGAQIGWRTGRQPSRDLLRQRFVGDQAALEKNATGIP